MDLILSTGSLYDRPFDQIVKEALHAGFSRLEVMLTPALMGQIEQVRDILRAGEVETPSVHAPFSVDRYVTSSNKIWTELMKKVIRAARIFEAEIITFHPGRMVLLPLVYERRWRNMLENVRDLLSLAGEAGVLLAIENMPRPRLLFFWKTPYLILEPMKMVRLFQELGSQDLKMTFDISHARTINRETISTYVKNLGSHFCNIHISDCDGKVDHLPIGKGEIPFDEFFQNIKSFRYDGQLTLELSPSHISAEDLHESKAKIERLLTTF